MVSHIESLGEFSPSRIYLKIKDLLITSIVGLVVEFVVAIDEARVRFTDDALSFFLSSFFLSLWNILLAYLRIPCF